jgi:tape measure domain-containing protein
MSDTVGRLTVVIDARIAQFEQRVQRAEQRLTTMSRSAQRDVKQIDLSFEGLGRGITQAARSIPQLGAAIAALSGGAAAGGGLAAVVRAGDDLVASMGRLSIATGSVERASEVYRALYQNSLQTGVAVSDSVAAFSRFSIAARDIGATNQQVVALTTGLQRAALAGGASTQEIQSGTLQLAQALASGVLQGDELRSILESMPTVAQGLARELGVSIGELRKMGSEGKLTADVVFPAMLRALQGINEEFERAPLTVSRAYGQLEVAATGFLGKLDEAIGLSQTLARNLGAAAQALAGLTERTFRSPAAQATVDAAASLARQAQLEAEITRLGSSQALMRRGTMSRQAQVSGQQPADQRIAELRQQLATEQAVLAEAIERQERLRMESNLDQQREEATAAERATAARTARATTEAQRLARELDGRVRITEAYQKRMDDIRAAAEGGGMDAATRRTRELQAQRERDDALATLARRGAGPAPRAERAVVDPEANRALAERNRLIESNRTPEEAYIARLERLGELVARFEGTPNAIPLPTVQAEAIDALNDYEDAIRRAGGAANEAQRALRKLGEQTVENFAEAIVQGKSLREVAQGLLMDLGRIFLRQAVSSSGLGKFFESAIGGVFGSFGGGGGASVKSANGNVFSGGRVVPFATGGVVSGATTFPMADGRTGLMGEAGAEAIMPLTRGPGGKLGVKAQGGGGTTLVQNFDMRGAMLDEIKMRQIAGQAARASISNLEERRRETRQVLA